MQALNYLEAASQLLSATIGKNNKISQNKPNCDFFPGQKLKKMHRNCKHYVLNFIMSKLYWGTSMQQ